jgi:protein sidekick
LAETASIEEGILYGSSVELRQSQKKITTLKRKQPKQGMNKPPPRPTPGSVTYTDDESDKAYDHNPDESSLTEKPSEISSTDSQVRETFKNDTEQLVVIANGILNANKLIDSAKPINKNGRKQIPTKLYPCWIKSNKIMQMPSVI